MDQDEAWKDLSKIEAQIPANEPKQKLSLKSDRSESQIAKEWPQNPLSETSGLQQPSMMATGLHLVQAQSLQQSMRGQTDSAKVPHLVKKAASAPNLRAQHAVHHLTSTSQNSPDVLSNFNQPPLSRNLNGKANKVKYHADQERINALYNCSIGEYPCLWYKFRRFESLSLFNLYLLQDRVIEFEVDVRNRIRGNKSLSAEVKSKQNSLLKEYHEALSRFREISQMKRPSMKQREEASLWLSKAVDLDYDVAPDSLGMVDLTPAALGVELDPLRLFLCSRRATTLESYAPRSRPNDRQSLDRRPTGTEARWRPYQMVSTEVDSMARIVVAILSALFLVAPMLALSYISVKWARLLTASLFILLFCIVTSAAPQAKNHEVIMMTAAYAAVIVVFVGQTS